MKWAYLPAFLFIMMLVFTSASPAEAQTLCENGEGYIERPAPGMGISSNMGPRSVPGGSPNHPGTDYNIPGRVDCGRTIPGPPRDCVLSNGVNGGKLPRSGKGDRGYGYYAQFDCGATPDGRRIQLQYAHLESANSYSSASNTLVVGDTGAGGCHLDYIMTVDGQTIDAQCSTGTPISGNYVYGNSSTRHGASCPITGQRINLCDSQTTNQLLEHGKKARQGVTKGPTMRQSDGSVTSPPDGSTGGGGRGTDSGGGGGSGTNAGTGGNDISPTYDPFLDYDPPVTRGNTGGARADPTKRTPDAPVDPYAPEAGTPVCENSTCITTQIYSKSKNENVDLNNVVDDIEKLEPTTECAAPTATNLTVKKQVPGRIEEHQDKFCSNQGCAYNEETDKCEPV